MAGYFAIGIEAGKTPENLGGLWRSAHAFGASYIFTVGCRYRHQPTDTSKAVRHIPLFEFGTVEQFLERGVPRDTEIVAVETAGSFGRGGAVGLIGMPHPKRAVYVLGGEDYGLSEELLDARDRGVFIPAEHCLNVATAGSIVLYDRIAKGAK